MNFNGNVQLSQGVSFGATVDSTGINTNGSVDGVPNININTAKDGVDGKNGADGKDGADGKSAYEQAVDGGFVGTEQEFTDALNNLNEIKNIMPLVYAGL